MQESKQIKIELADPTPLGLFGLALVTLVASTQKLGITDGLSLLLPWVIFLGATAQIIAGIMDFKHNNLFGATAFCGYGLFWYAIALTWMFKMGVFGETLATMDMSQLGFALFGYLILSIIITIGAFRLNTLLSILMIFIDFLFIGLSFDIFFGGHFWHLFAAVSEIIISILSFYGVAAAFINKSYVRSIIPLGKAWTK
jgi:succinate-acetate transporter protein